MHARGEQKCVDYILYYKPNTPIAIIEAKDNKHSLSVGMQQALNYADTLNIPFVFSSNGDAFLLHDRTGNVAETEQKLKLEISITIRVMATLLRVEGARNTTSAPYCRDAVL